MKTEISEKPILFSGEMVQAILSGRKTMTRRVVKPQPEFRGEAYFWYGKNVPLEENPIFFEIDGPTPSVYWFADRPEDSGMELHCPYGKPGDRLWVKEASWRWGRWVQQEFSTPAGRVKYRFDPVGNDVQFDYPGYTVVRNGSTGWVYRHARYMPRDVCRILLEITDIRVERLQEISEADAIAEGMCRGDIPADEDGPNRIGWMAGLDDGKSGLSVTTQDAFRKLWNQLNGPRGFDWNSNPFVWSINFELHRLKKHQ